MPYMTLSSEEIRQRFLDFFAAREHELIPSASLVPQDDPSVLFTTAGMQPLVPYLLGEPHPKGKRLANYQRCLRTNDIEEVGDATHLTFFEMLGNWSLGDYFKRDAIRWSYQLLTDPKEGFGLDPSRLYISVFAGGETAPRDEEAADIWRDLGVPDDHIFYLADNWWPAPDEDDTGSGPCGPDSEMFYDLTNDGVGDLPDADAFEQASDDGRLVEIWNDVFMQYKKENGAIVGELEYQNVDTGSGFERLTAVLQGKQTVFETDLFVPIIQAIRSCEPVNQEISGNEAERARRVIADHIRAAVFIIHDGVKPSNTDAGYVLRRLLRRAVQYADKLEVPAGSTADAIAGAVIEKYQGVYPLLLERADHIRQVIEAEEQKFRGTLASGLKEFEKYADGVMELSGEHAFKLFATFGMPIEMVEELAEERGITVDTESFLEAYKKHQEASKAGGQQRFKGGLAGSGSEMEREYHTATHLLNAALREVLGEQVGQKGSNITEDRLRFDFNHPDKLTDDEKAEIERIVNDKIQKGLSVTHQEFKLDEAYSYGAIGAFGEQYPDVVRVYTIGDEATEIFSKEICGGPHVENTAELNGTFRIKKEESVSAGVRRIKAVLE